MCRGGTACSCPPLVWEVGRAEVVPGLNELEDPMGRAEYVLGRAGSDPVDEEVVEADDC